MFRKTKPSGEPTPTPAPSAALAARVQAAWAFLRSGLSQVAQRVASLRPNRAPQAAAKAATPKATPPPTSALSERFAGVRQWVLGLRQWGATAPENYAAPLMRVLRQAPWRLQTQLTAVWAITLLIVAVVGGLYLSVASRAATAGRDVQTLEALKGELERQNDELRAELAHLRAVPNLAARAQMLGFQPATPEQVEYLRVNPAATGAVAVPQSTTTERLPTLTEWLAEALTGLLPQWHW